VDRQIMTTKLTDRAGFNQLAERTANGFAALSDGTRWTVSVGISECSIAKGALDTFEHLRMKLEDSGLRYELRRVGCGGWCWAEPFVTVEGPGLPPILYGNVDADRAPELVSAMQRGVAVADLAVGTMNGEAFHGIQPLTNDPFFGRQRRVLFENCGVIDPESIEDYIARGGYAAFVKALFDMSPDEIIEEMKISNVRGRGGAGFPAGIKWESARKARGNPKFVAVNSHEGEPNVYKDRRLIESNPHLILEGIMIACVAVGSERGYNYVGGEHVLALKRFRKAVEQAYEYGLLGQNILGTGINIEVRTRAGGGAYICGEGSALMYSVMGERGQPRTKPPRSVDEGLWRRPTMLNNTETIANAPLIISRGGDWYAAMGNEKSTGTKLITFQGPLKRLGVVEVEMGVSLRELIFDIYGGMQEGRTFKGVQTGGVSAGPLTIDQLDYPVDFDSLKPVDAMLGSGGFVIFDDTVCAVDFARYLQAFNRYESCSKCTPCRLGNPALVEIVDRIRFGNGRPGDIELIERTSKHVIELSLCGLGQVAPMPLLGMIKAYRDEFVAHIEHGICPTGNCPMHARTASAIAADG
jgi:NADH:ubiquinone oxidoreductase subunit F (NADH-binding)/(2Fe-2S) ferredoxin